MEANKKHQKAIVKLLLGAFVGVLSLLVMSIQTYAATPPSSATWWNGSCDHNASGMSGEGADGGSYAGIITCAPGPYYGGTEHDVSFLDINGTPVPNSSLKVPEFFCTELVFRYLWLNYSVTPYSITGGSDMVAAFNTSTYPNFTKYANDQGVAPQPGDVISFGTSGNPTDPNNAGHTAIIIKSNYNVASNGKGYFYVLQENSGSYYTEKVTMNNAWHVDPLSGNSAKTVEGWLHYTTSISPASLSLTTGITHGMRNEMYLSSEVALDRTSLYPWFLH